jgi:hypothetical protein
MSALSFLVWGFCWVQIEGKSRIHEPSGYSVCLLNDVKCGIPQNFVSKSRELCVKLEILLGEQAFEGVEIGVGHSCIRGYWA